MHAACTAPEIAGADDGDAQSHRWSLLAGGATRRDVVARSRPGRWFGRHALRHSSFPQGWRLDLVGIEPADQWPTMLGVAQRADAGPWESIWVYDHFHTVPVPTEEATHEAWTLMAAFAAATSRVRLGQMCTCMGYRNPAYLAKVAATVDVDLRRPGRDGHRRRLVRARVARLRLRLPVAPASGSRMLDEGVADHAPDCGRAARPRLPASTTRSTARICRPLPLQDGGIPLWIAGGGEKKTLRIAAQYASYTNFDATPEGFRHKSRSSRSTAGDSAATSARSPARRTTTS